MNKIRFCRLILSKRDPFLKKSILDRASYILKIEEKFSYDVELSLIKLIETEFELIKKLNFCLNNISSKNDFNLIDFFSFLDENCLNYICQKK